MSTAIDYHIALICASTYYAIEVYIIHHAWLIGELEDERAT